MSDTPVSTIIRLADLAPFRLGNLDVDPPARLLTAEGWSKRIEPRCMQVLAMLASARGSVVSRPAINAACWDGRQVSNDALDRVISHLRTSAAGIGAGSFTIETLPRVGFRLVETMTRSENNPPAHVVPAMPDDTASHLSRRRILVGAAVSGSAAVGAGLFLRTQAHIGATDLPDPTVRVAVLPFEADEEDPVSRRFGLGVARELRELFARIAGVAVIAAASSRHAFAAAPGTSAAGRRLQARFVVAGSVETEGRRVRVKASLVDARSGSTVGAVQAEGTPEQVFAVQDAIKGPLLRELVGRAGLVVPPVRSASAVDSRAYQLTLEAQDLVERSRGARMGGRADEAFDLADRADVAARGALAIAPEYPSALLVIAELVRYGSTRELAAFPLSPEQRVSDSIRYVTRALASDPNDPGALTALGDYYRRYRWRWDEAEALFRKALAINPSHVEAHWSYAYQLGTLGRGLEGLVHAAAVSRLDPETTWRRVALPRLLYLVGERGAAMARYGNELRTTPTNLFLITEMYLMFLTERNAGAIDALVATVERLTSGAARSPALAVLIAKLGDAAAALRGQPRSFVDGIDREVAAFDAGALNASATQGRASVDLLYLYAIEYAWAGAAAPAARMLDRALAAHSLYWPATLPFGTAPFARSSDGSGPFDAVWASATDRRDVVNRRRAALLSGQIAGTLPNGTKSYPAAERISDALSGVRL